MRARTDRDWDRLGRLDPYWAVLTHDEFRGTSAVDPAALNAFLASGREHIERLWPALESMIGGPFAPRRALDVGCGLGRITLPLAARCGTVLGIDVADSMLDKARALAADQKATNVRYATSDDRLSHADGDFDFIHSYIVFQHIPPARGLRLLAELTAKLADEGVAAIHVLHHNPDMANPVERAVKRTWRALKRPFRRLPQMEMNAYPLDTVFRIIQDAGARQIQVLPTDHGGCLGNVFCFQVCQGERGIRL